MTVMKQKAVYTDADLAALLAALSLLARQGNPSGEYIKGFAAAIAAVAVAVGVPATALGDRLRGFDGSGRLADAGHSYTREGLDHA